MSYFANRLGLAYGGSNRNDVLEMLSPVFSDPNSSFEVINYYYQFYLHYCTCIFTGYLLSSII